MAPKKQPDDVTKITSTEGMTEAEISKAQADFMEQRQAAIDAENEDDEIDARTEYGSGFHNPPAIRATDGGKPGTKERKVLDVAADLEGPAREVADAEKNARKAAKKAAEKAAKDAK